MNEPVASPGALSELKRLREENERLKGQLFEDRGNCPNCQNWAWVPVKGGFDCAFCRTTSENAALREDRDRLCEEFLKLRDRAFKYAEKGYSMNAREIELLAYGALNPQKPYEPLDAAQTKERGGE